MIILKRPSRERGFHSFASWASFWVQHDTISLTLSTSKFILSSCFTSDNGAYCSDLLCAIKCTATSENRARFVTAASTAIPQASLQLMSVLLTSFLSLDVCIRSNLMTVTSPAWLRTGSIHLYIHYVFFLWNDFSIISWSWHKTIPIAWGFNKMEFQFFKFQNLRDGINCL